MTRHPSLPIPRILICLGLAALLPAPLFAQAAEQEPFSYAVRAGDRVTIKLYTAAGEEISVVGGERTIDRNGELFLPYVQTLFISGLDQPGLRELLTERYSEFYDDPVVDVKVDLKVSVTGSVRLPGQYYLDPTATIVDALAAAGGMNAELIVQGGLNIPADQGAVRLVRDGVTTILNLRPDEVENRFLHEPIQSGDWIHVPPRGRATIRDQVTFWGGVVGFITNVVILGFVIAR